MIKIKEYSLLLLLLALSSSTFSQENIDLKKNAVDIAIGGNGLFISTNYSRIVLVKPNYFINTLVGIGTIPSVGGVTLPHQITFNIGKNSSYLELGIGGTFWSGKSNSSGYSETVTSYQLSPIIGWRKNFKNNLVFRAYANPLFHISGEYFIEDYSVVPYAGVSLGYAFKIR